MTKVTVMLVTLFVLAGCIPSSTNVSSFAIAIDVYNPLDLARKNAVVRIPRHTMHEMFPAFNIEATGLRVIDREAEIPYELKDETFVVVLDSMKGRERRTLNVYYVTEPNTYKKRTQAELSHKVGGEWKNREYIGGQLRNVDSMTVPPEHKDHSWFIRYEGPGWESDLVGYRLYLDQRNAIDVFGKKTTDMVLLGVGQDGFDSYHEMSDWGMDVAKVGKSLGIGSLGMWIDTSAVRVEKTDRVTCAVGNRFLSSEVILKYVGWKTPKDTIDVNTWLTIHAGTRWTLSSNNVMDRDDVKLCTGIVKDKNAHFYKSTGNDSTYGYIATFGKQSLNGDNLGLVVAFDNASFAGFQEDAFSHVVELKEVDAPTSLSTIDYYFAAAWEGEPNGITNEADFIKYVERSARELANPVVVTPKLQQ